MVEMIRLIRATNRGKEKNKAMNYNFKKNFKMIKGIVYNWTKNLEKSNAEHCAIDSASEDSDVERDPEKGHIIHSAWEAYTQRLITHGFDVFDLEPEVKRQRMEDHLALLQSGRGAGEIEAWAQTELTIFIRLQVVRPCVWRKVVVPGNLTLAELQEKVINPAMGWCMRYHSYCFAIPGRKEKDISYGPVGISRMEESYDSHNLSAFRNYRTVVNDDFVYVRDVLTSPGDCIRYIYDLGCRWKHQIVLDAINPATPGVAPKAHLVDGENPCPIEDFKNVFEYGECLSHFEKGGKLNGPRKQDNHFTIATEKFNSAKNYRPITEWEQQSPFEFNLTRAQEKVKRVWSGEYKTALETSKVHDEASLEGVNQEEIEPIL